LEAVKQEKKKACIVGTPIVRLNQLPAQLTELCLNSDPQPVQQPITFQDAKSETSSEEE